MNQKTAVVTGANRGIGFEIARQLGALKWEVLLTARNAIKGSNAASELRKLGYDVDFLELDVANEVSISDFIRKLGDTAPEVDVLINNAGVYLDGNQQAHRVDFDIVHDTMQVNFYGPWQLIIGILPFLRKSSDPRIINISSGMGALNEMGGGYPAYRVSKTALNSLTKMLASELSSIKISTMCPGWVRTDMGGSGATRSVEKGAETAIWLATGHDISSGKFYRDKKVIKW